MGAGPAGLGRAHVAVKGPLTPATMKHVRKMLELTQHDMANLLGVKPRIVVHWEKGEVTPNPIWVEAYVLLRSALKLGIDPAKIVLLSKGSIGRLRFYRKLGNLVVESQHT